MSVREPKLFKYTNEEGDQILRIRRYGLGWADIYIGSNGQFSALSDYGNYGYIWGHVGGREEDPYLQRFAKFLCGVEDSPDYYMNKLCSKMVFDAESTVNSVQQTILELRREGSLDKRSARSEWDRLDPVEDEFTWYEFMQETEIPDLWEASRQKFDGQIVAFVEEIMIKVMAPLLREYLGESKPPALRLV